jgi:sulfur carrier protein ThiS
MEVEVKLFNLLRRYSPCGQTVFPVQLPLGASLKGLLRRLGIPPAVQRIVLVNGRRVGEEALLSPDDTVVLMSPIEGG